MNIPFYQVDAFANKVFAGNPAGVCLLDEWPSDDLMQSIAAENNLPETAFLVRNKDHYDLRWFTPTLEIDLCGHATLASGYVIFEFIDCDTQQVEFSTMSGKLTVKRQDDLLSLDLPSRIPSQSSGIDGIQSALGATPSEVLTSRDLMVVFDDEETIRNLKPDMSAISEMEFFAVIVTAPGKECDFVSRFFAPAAGIPEDPVTGSAYCTLVPYWSERIGKKELHSFQLSQRGGELFCADHGNRVALGGQCALYLIGEIMI